MKLREYEGKQLFQKYGIEVPQSELIDKTNAAVSMALPVVLKAQVLSGDRKKHGGIAIADSAEAAANSLKKIFETKIEGESVEKVLAEEKIDFVAEYYASFSYDTTTRGPVLSVSPKGGSGIAEAQVDPADILLEILPEVWLEETLKDAGFSDVEIPSLSDILQKLWQLFLAEYALLAEINPIFKTKEGKLIAGDSKVILDDEKVNPNEKRFVSMGGDIAILASGGGASMLNIDALLEYGGKPANYTEYSGNPKADVVKNLTNRVLSQEGINGLWVVGGTANFTDIFETLSGFLEGLESLSEKPKYPIVMRRDGPRGAEGREMVKQFAKDKGYDIHVYGPEMSMEQSAKLIVELAQEYKNRK